MENLNFTYFMVFDISKAEGKLWRVFYWRMYLNYDMLDKMLIIKSPNQWTWFLKLHFFQVVQKMV